MIHPCDGQPDRQTDGRAIAYSALSIMCVMLSRAKKKITRSTEQIKQEIKRSTAEQVNTSLED